MTSVGCLERRSVLPHLRSTILVIDLNRPMKVYSRKYNAKTTTGRNVARRKPTIRITQT